MMLQAGFTLVTVKLIIIGLLIFFTGKLLDHMALQRFVPIVLLGLACGAFLMAFTPTPLLLFPAFFLLRQCGQGLMTLTNTVSMNRYLEKARGRAMAITGFGGPMTILYPILALFMIRLFGWQQAWMYYGIFILCILMPVFFLLFRHHDRTIHSAWKESMARNDASEDANPIRRGSPAT